GCSKGAVAIEGRRVAECTVFVDEGSSGVEREIAIGNLCSKGLLLVVNKEDGSEKSLLATLVRQEITADCDQFVASLDQSRWQRKITTNRIVPQESVVGCDGSERSLPIALCSKRSLLVMIKSLSVTIKVDGSERLLLSEIKEDDNERLLHHKSLLVTIKVDGSVCVTRDACYD
ncbi:hypothetical protein B296_00047493, partial [Ensete ventricosum]